MKLTYITNARLPTEKAHGLQIMKTCEALVRSAVEVELIAPRRRNSITEDPFLYYGIATRFPVRRVFTIDIPMGRIGFLLQEISFAIAATLALSRERGRIIYSRDELILFVLSFFGAHDYIWESHVGAWNFAARSVAWKAKWLVVISGGLKDFYVQHGIDPKKIAVIPSSYDPEAFAHAESKAAARARLGLSADGNIAMYIGRLDGWKGSAALLDASMHLPEDILVVVLGGEQKQVDQLKEHYPRVRFLGYRSTRELANNQAAADVLVVPNTGSDIISTRFTSPMKLIAAMASGRPIIASDLPSIRELTGDDAALLVTPDNSKALADGIEKLFRNPERGAQLVKRAKEKVRAYTWEVRGKAIKVLL